MQMINEVTVMQSNKNLFNKILVSLKKGKSVLSKKPPRVLCSVKLNSLYPDVRFYIAIYYGIGNIYTIQDSDKVFFCAEIIPKVEKIATTPSRGGDQFPEDPALSFISYKKEYLENGLYWRIPDDLRDWLESGGITKNSTPDEIKKTDVYAKLDKAVKDIQGMTFDAVLKKDVQKKLKTRENVVPVIIYTPSSDEFNYPFDKLPDSSTLNATSCRTNRSRKELMEGSLIIIMCKEAMRYTPYTYWTTLVMKNRPSCVDNMFF